MIFRIYSSIAYYFWRVIFGISLRLFFRYRVEGRENIPDHGSFIMASNHVSYMDPPVLGATTWRRLYFVASVHLYKNKLAKWWYRSLDCMQIRRGKPDYRAMRKILDCLKEGKPIAIFPEGARSQDGKVKEALAGIGFLALKSRVPVVPCFIKGSEKALPAGAKFFRSAEITIYIGKPIATDTIDPGSRKREAYRSLSKLIMDNIAQLHRLCGSEGF